MNMKKGLVLLLVVIMAVVLCTACAKKEEKEKTISMKVSIENKTGEEIEKLTLKDKISSLDQAWEVTNIGIDKTAEVTIYPAVKNEAPDVDITVTAKSGNTVQTILLEKGDKNIVLTVNAEGGLEAEITAK